MDPRSRDRFALARWDDDSDNDLVYVALVDPGGRWVIEKYDIANESVTYSRGEEDFTTNWTNRAALSYAEYYSEF